ncbi:MAG: glucokinase [Spirochaetia bacterium]
MIPMTGDNSSIILAGDIGGTNTNLALIERKKDSFTILYRERYKTQKVDTFDEPVVDFIGRCRGKGLPRPSLSCVSGAGPVHNGVCELTNAGWDISEAVLERILEAPSWVINDFTALSYSLPLLEIENPEKVMVLRQPKSLPSSAAGTLLRGVIGPGTGLGVGFLIQRKGRYIACSSEGGHSDFSPFDHRTAGLKTFLELRLGRPIDAEEVLSGRGIANIFTFLVSGDSGGTEKDAGPELSDTVRRIEQLPYDERPAEIARHAPVEPLCRETMECFLRIYARFAGSLSTVLLPYGGLYLAGGIAAKNRYLFEDTERFFRYFHRTAVEGTREILEQIPVYLVLDYDTSLLGAAHAAVILAKE